MNQTGKPSPPGGGRNHGGLTHHGDFDHMAYLGHIGLIN